MRAEPTTPGVPCCAALRKHAAARAAFMEKSDHRVQARCRTEAASLGSVRAVGHLRRLAPRLQPDPRSAFRRTAARLRVPRLDADRVPARRRRTYRVSESWRSHAPGESGIIPSVPHSGGAGGRQLVRHRAAGAGRACARTVAGFKPSVAVFLPPPTGWSPSESQSYSLGKVSPARSQRPAAPPPDHIRARMPNKGMAPPLREEIKRNEKKQRLLIGSRSLCNYKRGSDWSDCD